MRMTILFGGTNKERLVSVASAQALHLALPDADLWFWDADDSVHETRPQVLLKHSRPFEEPFKPGSPSLGKIEAALDRAQAEDRLLVFGLLYVVAVPNLMASGVDHRRRRRSQALALGLPALDRDRAHEHPVAIPVREPRPAELAGGRRGAREGSAALWTAVGRHAVLR